eukprot:CAMPEP_0182875286 /NCGR_PEP_ID=MMETSP0034_2-20130328/13448_1 /TAXON_ID=156128 /ORGANISM="Nephroselmis pyriformis, Strain CCMP717" /LENGTH=396 /DNA_ID=CAMNT_0025008021 /DNA_START=143 /DNA_END=1333 /DNA_ORIENTATION=-
MTGADAAYHPGLDRLGVEVLEQMKLGSNLDSAFHKTVFEIEQRIGLLSKQHKVRIKAWLKKLCENALTDNVVLKKNRNAWARLLLEHLRRGRLEPPFERKPDEGPLKQLQKWWTYGYSDKRYGTVPAGAGRPQGGSCRDCGFGYSECLCRSSPGMDGVGRAGAALGSLTDAGYGIVAPGGLVASKYLSPPRHASPARRPLSAGAGAVAYHQHASPELRVASPAKRAEKSARRKQMEVQLGASRERCMELEWRLQCAEERLQRQQEDLQRTRKKTEVTLQARTEEGKRSRRARRAELDDMISRFETRRSAWSPSAGGGNGGGKGWSSPPSTGPGPLPQSVGGASSRAAVRSPATAAAYAAAIARGRYGEADSDTEFVDFLDDFKQHTDALRGRIGGH